VVEPQASFEPPFEPLVIIAGKPVVPSTGWIGCYMLVQPSGQDDKIQWFELRATPVAEPVSYEWDIGIPFAAFPPEAANLLIYKGYARIMTPDEVTAYNTGSRKVDDSGIPEILKRSPTKETKP
jgi:hypothetical protein